MPGQCAWKAARCAAPAQACSVNHIFGATQAHQDWRALQAAPLCAGMPKG